MGQLKGPCKHKSIVSTTQNIPSFDVVPTENPEMRALFMYLGTGKKQNPNWFKPLSSAATEQVEPTGILDKIEDIAQPLVEEEEDIQVDAIDDIDEGEEKLEQLKTRLKHALSKLEDKIGGRIKEDVKGYEKAILCI